MKSYQVAALIPCISAILLFALECLAFAGQKKHEPPPSRIQPLQLKQPFTLVYKAAVQWNNNERMVHENLLLTLSYNAQRLLYTSEKLDSHVTSIYLYNGKETYVMHSDSGIAEIDPGFDFSRMLYCPLPGLGIPNMPFFTNGAPANVLSNFIQRAAPNVKSEAQFVDAALYQTPSQVRDYGFFSETDRNALHSQLVPRGLGGMGSVVTTLSSGVPKVLWYEGFYEIGKPYLGRLWQFYEHTPFQGLWLAKSIKMRSDGSARETGLRLYKSAMYTLQSARNQSLEPRAFDPANYLHKHANITDFTGTSARSFPYELDRGSLEVQRQSNGHIGK